MQKLLDGLMESEGKCRRESGEPISVLRGLSVIQPAQQALSLRMHSVGPLQLVRIKLELRSKDERSAPTAFEANMPTAMSGPKGPT